MPEYIASKRRLDLKIVYYGPALSGKTTNLVQLHNLLHPQRKAELMVLETQNDRTLFFDLLPIGLRSASGLDLRMKLYTVPGQVQHDSTRKAVLSRADGVIFVGDSVESQQENNAIAFDNLTENLDKLGMAIERIPLVLQFNKRDVSNIVPENEVLARWRSTPWPDVAFASAIQGKGVLETFRAVLTKLYPVLDSEFGLSRTESLDLDAFLRGLTGLEASADVQL